MLGYKFSFADLMMIAIVFFGTIAMMITGSLTVKRPTAEGLDEPAPPPESDPISEHERLASHYRAKWGSSDAEVRDR
jgi:hypothetical protein